RLDHERLLARAVFLARTVEVADHRARMHAVDPLVVRAELEPRQSRLFAQLVDQLAEPPDVDPVDRLLSCHVRAPRASLSARVVLPVDLRRAEGATTRPAAGCMTGLTGGMRGAGDPSSAPGSPCLAEGTNRGRLRGPMLAPCGSHPYSTDGGAASPPPSPRPTRGNHRPRPLV